MTMIRAFVSLICLVGVAAVLRAQEVGDVPAAVDVDEVLWYEGSGVWIGAAVFVVIILLILRRPRLRR